jgi:peptide/nickel transport system substrate-binding protein
VTDLIKQYLGAVGITVDYVPTPLQNAIQDILAPKYAASYFILQQDSTAWQTAQFEISPAATFNVFHVQDPQVDSLLQTMQKGSDADAADAAKQLNKYVVDQAWFVPFYRLQSGFAGDKTLDVKQQSDNAYPYLYNITPKA